METVVLQGKCLGVDLFLSCPLAVPTERTVALTSQEDMDSPPSLAEGGPPAHGWTHGQTGPPRGPTEGGAAAGGAGSGGLRTPALAREAEGLGLGQDSSPGGSSGASGEGGARRGFHPRMRTRTFAVSSPPSSKAEAIIYSPFRFAERAPCELDIQTPPARELEKRRPRRGRPCAAAGPGTPPPRPARDHTALSGRGPRAPLLTQKHKSAPHPLSRNDPAASPPSLVLKGPAGIQHTARGGRGVGALRAEGSTGSRRARRPGLRGSLLRGGTRRELQPRPSHTPYPRLPLLSPSLLHFLAFKEGGR